MTATLMVRPHRRSTADLVLRAASRGAILIGVAVVIGVVLLQVVDKGGGGGGAFSPTPATSGSNISGTTTTLAAGRTAAEVTVFVQNGSGVNQAAATLSNDLRGKGYAISGTGNAPVQTGTTVACVAGFEAEATALAAAIGGGATVATFPDPVPPGAENSNCIATRGS